MPISYHLSGIFPSIHFILCYLVYATCIIGFCSGTQTDSAPPASLTHSSSLNMIQAPNVDAAYVRAGGSGTECTSTNPCASLMAAVIRSSVEDLELIQILSNIYESLTQSDATVNITHSLRIIGESPSTCKVTIVTEPYASSIIQISIDRTNNSTSVQVVLSSLTFSFHINSSAASSYPLITVSSSEAAEGALTSLSLSTVVFDGRMNDSSSYYGGASLISATDGVLYLSDVSFFSLKLSSYPLLDININGRNDSTVPSTFNSFSPNSNQPSFFMYGYTSFTNISRSSGNGSIISVTLDDTSCVYLSNASFTNCSCRTGSYGGSIYMYVSSQLSEENLMFSDLSFSGNGGKTIGRYVFIEEKENGFVPSSTWDSLIEDVRDVKDNFILSGPDTELPDYIDLIDKSYKLRKYQLALLIVLSIFGFIFFLRSFCSFVVYSGSSSGGDDDASCCMRIVDLITYLFKFGSLISLSFLPESFFILSTESFFSIPFFRHIFEFGKGIFSFLEGYYVYIKFFIGFTICFVMYMLYGCSVLIYGNNLFAQFTGMTPPKAFRTGSNPGVDLPPVILIPLGFLLDQLFETIIEWMFPVFVCTQYYGTDEEMAQLDLPFIGREASCYNKANMAFFIISFIFLLVLENILFSVYSTRLKNGTDTFSSDLFTVFQAFLQVIQVSVAVFSDGKPWATNLVAFLTSGLLALASIYFIKTGFGGFSRTIDPFIYTVSSLTSLFAMIGEFANGAVKALSIASFVFIVLGIIIVFVVFIRSFSRRRVSF